MAPKNSIITMAEQRQLVPLTFYSITEMQRNTKVLNKAGLVNLHRLKNEIFNFIKYLYNYEVSVSTGGTSTWL